MDETTVAFGQDVITPLFSLVQLNVTYLPVVSVIAATYVWNILIFAAFHQEYET